MKIANRLRGLGALFFLLLWIPFAMTMLTGPFSTAIWGPDPGGGMFWSFMPWLVLTVAFGLLCVFFFVASLFASGLSNISIMAKGRDAEATIISIRDTGTRVNDNPVIDFSLDVRPPDSPGFKAVARKMVLLIDLPSIQPGNTVHVRYVPGKEHVAIIDARDLEMLKAKGLLGETK